MFADFDLQIFNGNCTETNAHLTDIGISESNFTSNNAYDGYAIYFEGDDPEFQYSIAKNNFIDNYNANNHEKDEPNKIFGAVIVTEFCSIKEEKINSSNNFKYTENVLVKSTLCFDQTGNTPSLILTASNEFTYSNAFSNSNPFPTNVFSPMV